MNEHIIKISGKASIPEELVIGNNYKIECDGSVTERKENDKFDGDSIITWKFEPINVEIVDDKGKRIKAKDPRSDSKKRRACLYRAWEETNQEIDSERFYHQKMVKIIDKVINGEI